MQTASSRLNALRFAAAIVMIAPRRAAESVLVTLGLGLTEGVGLLLLVPLLQLVGVDAQQGPLNRVVTVFSLVFSTVGLRPTLGVVLVVYIVVIGLQGLLQQRQSSLNSGLQQEIVTALRVRVYRAIAAARWAFVARSRSSDFSHVLTDEVDRVGSAVYYLVDLAVTAVISLVYLALALRVSPAMTALVVLCGAALALTMRGKMTRARRIGEKYSSSRTRLHAAVSEQLASLKMAKSYGAEGRHDLEFIRLSDELSAVDLAATSSYARLRQQLSIGAAVVLAIVVYVAHGVLTLPTAQLLLLLFLFARLVPRLTGLYEKSQMLTTLLPAYAAVGEIERRCAVAAEPTVAHPLGIELSRQIAFERVIFDYRDDGQAPAVRDLDLVVAAGATTAIVGASGSGKSTLADLLMGLLQPAGGRILVDGVPLAPDRLDAWRDQIGYVSQDTFLFHDSLRANLLWARPTATEPDLWHALELAAAADFVRALPRGLETVVGDRGVLVSGGERQRLSLARALVRRPRLLLLDEATSSLDSENERRVQLAIDNLHQQMTIVVITHRLSTIRGADLIYVLERGRIAESGTWDQLTALESGRFRELCRAQGFDSRREVWNPDSTTPAWHHTLAGVGDHRQ